MSLKNGTMLHQGFIKSRDNTNNTPGEEGQV